MPRLNSLFDKIYIVLFTHDDTSYLPWNYPKTNIPTSRVRKNTVDLSGKGR